MHRYVRVQGTDKESVHTVEMGNVTADAELTFEYGVKQKENIEEKGNCTDCITEFFVQLLTNYFRCHFCYCQRAFNTA